MKSAESKVAGTITQRKVSFNIGGTTYEVAPPSCATLILLSEELANIPAVELNHSEKYSEVLRWSKNFRPLARAVAILVLGAENLTEERTIVEKRVLGLIPIRKSVKVDKIGEIGDVLIRLSPSELKSLFLKMLAAMEIEDFFDFTTSLLELNLLKPTKEVVN